MIACIEVRLFLSRHWLDFKVFVFLIEIQIWLYSTILCFPSELQLIFSAIDKVRIRYDYSYVS